MQTCTIGANGLGLETKVWPLLPAVLFIVLSTIYYAGILALLPIIASNADTSDIDPSVEPGVRTAKRSAAPIGPGVREHKRAHRAAAGGEAVLTEHASALQAAARVLENTR